MLPNFMADLPFIHVWAITDWSGLSFFSLRCGQISEYIIKQISRSEFTHCICGYTSSCLHLVLEYVYHVNWPRALILSLKYWCAS